MVKGRAFRIERKSWHQKKKCMRALFICALSFLRDSRFQMADLALVDRVYSFPFCGMKEE